LRKRIGKKIETKQERKSFLDVVNEEHGCNNKKAVEMFAQKKIAS
jgi:hypothetical protein